MSGPGKVQGGLQDLMVLKDLLDGQPDGTGSFLHITTTQIHSVRVPNATQSLVCYCPARLHLVPSLPTHHAACLATEFRVLSRSIHPAHPAPRPPKRLSPSAATSAATGLHALPSQGLLHVVPAWALSHPLPARLPALPDDQR